tara:strand:+ start:39 stop:443 length:405 start_codon:yes stop_codon:yes gene_type:complete
MKKILKNDDAYKSIGEVAKMLGLVDKKTGHIQTHTIRFWETKFKQIKPSIRAGNRRYYSANDVEMIRHIKYLLKDKGLTINGVKKVLNKKKDQLLDDNINIGVYKSNLKTRNAIKDKIKNISKIIKEIKKIKNG